MRIAQLTISGFRGITAALQLSPGGDSYVLHGPNGSGKSSVVDAIDFLLTGKIRRLSGTGMQQVTLARHGHHINVLPDDTYVEADVQLPGRQAPVTIRRTLSDPHTLVVPEDAREAVEAAVAAAQQGLHILTRRDILAFIAIEPGRRLDQVQRLLNLAGVSQTRSSLVTVNNQARQRLEQSEEHVRRAEEGVARQFEEPTYDESVVLQKTNALRHVLGGDPLPELESARLKMNLMHAPQEGDGSPINTAAYGRDHAAFHQLVEESSTKVEGPLEDLRSSLLELRGNDLAARALEVDRLVVQGIALLDSSESCPLCDVPWDPAKLQEHLEEKHASAAEYSTLMRRVQSYAGSVRDQLNRAVQASTALLSPLRGLEFEEATGLQEEIGSIRDLVDRLSRPLELQDDDLLLEGRTGLNGTWQSLLNAASACAEQVQHRFPAPSAARDSWDELTRLQVGLDQVSDARADLNDARLVSARATVALQAFQQARDNVLATIYSDVSTSFENYYRALHGRDEAEFEATLVPRDGALDFEVDFYGLGQHPPVAFHSEGHQDSMGICLFLALGEYLGAGALDLFLLDDVVMSVDAGHRRRLAELLQRDFPRRQFIITTHDGTWARQLRSAGVVTSRNAVVELFGWNLQSGPSLNDATDPFEKIEQLLDADDVPGAAHLLRRNSEAFFRGLAEGIGAKVTFRGDGRWELQDFVSGVVSAYTSHLKRAKQHVRQHGADPETIAAIEETHESFRQILARTQAEQWAINDNVHYNHWPEFSADDFRFVVEAFKDLYAVFVCSTCGSEILLVENAQASVVTCSCGATSFHLAPH